MPRKISSALEHDRVLFTVRRADGMASRDLAVPKCRFKLGCCGASRSRAQPLRDQPNSARATAVVSAGGDDCHDQRRAEANCDDRRREATRRPSSATGALPADRLRNDDCCEKRRGEQSEGRQSCAREPVGRRGGRALRPEGSIVNAPTSCDDQPGRAHGRQSPGGTDRAHPRSGAPPPGSRAAGRVTIRTARKRGDDRPPARRERKQQDEEERRKQGVEPESLGIAEEVAAEHAERGSADPARKEQGALPRSSKRRSMRPPPICATAHDSSMRSCDSK